MRFSRNALLWLLILFICASCGGRQKGFQEAQSLTEAKILAMEQNTMIVADFWFEGCGPCRAFARDVEEKDPQLMDALKGLVLLSLNLATPEGAELAEVHNVHAFPTYLVLNAEGEIVYSWSGYGRPADWAKTLLDALSDPVSIQKREARFAADPNFRDALILGKVAHRESRYLNAEGYYRRAEALDPIAAAQEDVPIHIFRAIFYGVGTGDFSVDQAAATVEELLRAEDIKPEHALEISDRLIGVKDQVGEEVIIPYLKQAYPIVSELDDPKLQEYRQKFLVDFALIVDKSSEKALSLKKEFMPWGWQSNPSDLNDFAWWYFENKINLEEAERLSQRSISLSEPGKEQSNYLDTLAELVNLRGDTEEAIELIEKALKMNPESEYLKRQLAKFREILTESQASSSGMGEPRRM